MPSKPPKTKIRAAAKKKAEETAQKIADSVAKRKAAKLASATRPQKQGAPAVKENRLELLFTIVNRNKAEFYIDLLQSFEINVQLVMLGHGTADPKTLALFGYTESDKAILVGVIQEKQIQTVMTALDEKFRTIKNGNGISYTVPISSVIGTLIFGFLSNNRMTVKDNSK